MWEDILSENTLHVILLTITFVGCFVLLVLIVIEFKKKIEEIVETRSKSCNKLKEINELFDFWEDIQQEYTFRKSAKSKQQYDRLDIDKFFQEKIQVYIKDIESIIEKVKDNQLVYKHYIDEVENINIKTTKEDIKGSKIPYFLFEKLEPKVFEKKKINPIVAPEIKCIVQYTSPQGRNHYKKGLQYNFFELVEHYENVKENIRYRQTKTYQQKHQRKIMTESLRYDILKRDGFKCVLCGRTVADGAKLHVDHIKPISKGGQTVASNLRTLCDKCNFGKSDKYDEFGDN